MRAGADLNVRVWADCWEVAAGPKGMICLPLIIEVELSGMGHLAIKSQKITPG